MPSRSHTLGGSAAQRLPKVLAPEELAALMRMPNLATPTGLRDRCMLMLMHRCGLRVSEACGLHLGDVDWRSGEVHIRPEVAKGGREAMAYMDGPTLAMLERWRAVRPAYARGKPHLFVGVRTEARGEALNRRLVYKMVVRRAAKAGIERRVHPHMLRHCYATELLEEGFTLAEVQALMRHSSVHVTAVYLHVRDRELAGKIRRRGDPQAS